MRVAGPILAAFAAIFLAIMGYLLHLGFGTTGAAFGPGGVAEQGDARIAATPAPLATQPPGAFSVPQTGTGPIGGGTSLPGASVGGGPPPAVANAVATMRARLARNPDDLGALLTMGRLELAANRPQAALTYLRRADKIDPMNDDVRTLYAQANAAAKGSR